MLELPTWPQEYLNFTLPKRSRNPSREASSVTRQPREKAGKTCQRWPGASLLEPSYRQVNSARYLSLYT